MTALKTTLVLLSALIALFALLISRFHLDSSLKVQDSHRSTLAELTRLFKELFSMNMDHTFYDSASLTNNEPSQFDPLEGDVSARAAISYDMKKRAEKIPLYLIPKPKFVQVNAGGEGSGAIGVALPVNPQLNVVFFKDQSATVDVVARSLCTMISFYLDHDTRMEQIEADASNRISGAIQLVHLNKNPFVAQDQDENYEVIVKNDKILVQAYSPRGLFRGAMTVLQLIFSARDANEWDADNQAMSNREAGWLKKQDLVLPEIHIRDESKFKWRGMLLDVCRHFFDKHFVKKYIDLLALYKMNVFHWHLTEDQAFRIEIKKYPRLTSVGAYRELRADELADQEFLEKNKDFITLRDEKLYYGGFYTQEDIKEIVQYAADRFIQVVPEIELPGHAVASLAGYPEHSCTGKDHFDVEKNWGVHKDVYCAGNEKTFSFLEDVLTEVIELFPNSTHIHIGGDECPKDRWRRCPKCQKRIKEEKLRNEHELQSYFIRRIGQFLASKNRKFIGWDEILEGGLAPGAIVQAWRSMDGAVTAVRLGHDAIASPLSHCYLDYDINTIDLEHIYSFKPEQYASRGKGNILGGEVNCWTEHMRTEGRVNYMVFPRLLAMSEVLWTVGPRDRYYEFLKRVQQQRSILQDFFDVEMGPETDLLTISTRIGSNQNIIVRAQLKKPGTTVPRELIKVYFSTDGSEPKPDPNKTITLGREISIPYSQTLLLQGFVDGISYGKSYLIQQ